MSDAASTRPSRAKVRASSAGQVWCASDERMVPVGQLLDFSEGGLRYRHDPRALHADGFPICTPESGQALQLAVTLHPGDRLRPIHAQALRAALAADGSVEVACRFEAQGEQERAQIHRKFVDASLQRTRQHFSALHASLFNAPSPRPRGRVPLGKILARRQAIDRTDLNRFLTGNRGGIPLGARLVKAGLVSGRQLAEALSEHVGVPFVDLDAAGVEPQALRVIRAGTALRLGAVAFGLERKILKVAAARPLSGEERAELEHQSRLRVRTYLADPGQIAAILRGSVGGKSRRARHALPAQLRVQYRFYSMELQQLDPSTFEGDAANLSETGILIRGAVPADLEAAFRKSAKPRVLVAVRLRLGAAAPPLTLRFEPVRITALQESGPGAPPSGRAGAPECWIGARVAAVLPEDRKNLVKLCARIQAP